MAEHLLLSDPAADEWVVQRLVRAARAATRSGAPESAAVYLRRVLVEPPPPGELPGLLLELGMAEASAGLGGWADHLEAALDGAGDDGGRLRPRWCSRSRSGARTDRPRRSGYSIAPRRWSIQARNRWPPVWRP